MSRPAAIRDHEDVIGMYRKVYDPKKQEWIWKFVGKVFMLQDYLAELAGDIIHYREESSQDVRAWSLDNAYSIDVAAWNCAKHYGAKWMTVYLTDVDEFWYADAETVDGSDRQILDDNEGMQIRVPWDLMEPYGGKIGTKVPKPAWVPTAERSDCIILNEWELSTPAAVPKYVPRRLRSSPVAGSAYLTP